MKQKYATDLFMNTTPMVKNWRFMTKDIEVKNSLPKIVCSPSIPQPELSSMTVKEINVRNYPNLRHASIDGLAAQATYPVLSNFPSPARISCVFVLGYAKHNCQFGF